jgi:cytochrome c
MKKVLGTILVGVLFMSCGEGKHTAEATPAQQLNTTNTTETNTTETKIDSKTSTATIVATSSTSTATAAAVPPTASKEDIEKGMTLLAKSDCLTCHKLNEKVIGPSYKEVAKKYANKPSNIKMLAGKIINGGSGVWGAIPMTAHATLSQADAELMVKYIMSLK